MSSRALILSGGAFRGAFQVPIITELNKQYKYDAIYGVSVGAINGSMFAQQEVDQLVELWNDATKFSNFFSSRCYFPFFGFYSMKPLRNKIEEYLKLNKIQIPFVAGITSFTDGKYYNLSTEKMITDKELWDSVEASSCIAGFMVPPTISIDGKNHIGCDGGYRNSIPIPKESYDVFDVVVCRPLGNCYLQKDDHYNFIVDSIMRSVEIFKDENFTRDLDQIKKFENTKIRVFAPSEELGSSFSTSQELLDFRFKLGREALNNPVILK